MYAGGHFICMREPKVITIGDVIDSTVKHINDLPIPIPIPIPLPIPIPIPVPIHQRGLSLTYYNYYPHFTFHLGC